MPQRLAAILAVLAFVVCIVVGGLEVGNPFGITVERALKAMMGTFVVGYLIGWMIEKMNAEQATAVTPDKKEDKATAQSR